MSHRSRVRLLRLAGVVALGAALLLPAAAPAAAADPVVLTVGTTQDMEASNPFNDYLVVEYEAFQLTYNLLVEFDSNAKPAPGFADSWVREPDKVTFHIREGMKWSDGEPASSADACYSWGLALAAIKDGKSIGYGYLEPGIKDAGVTKIECPDATTLIAYTTDQSDRIYQAYVPILPEHIYGKLGYKQIEAEKFDPPLVGTGPYTMVEWKTGQFARFERNPNYWGNQGFADQVVLRFFPDATDTMFQALKAGEIDYAHNVNSDQFKQLQADPAYTTVVGKANGWTQLAFNTYGTGTGKTIKNGGPSTKALLDPAFRDALGYAVDKRVLVDRVIGGFGDVGTTNVPPILSDWHVEPATPRTFDLALADQKLTAAGYLLEGGKRLDKEGKAINLRMYAPNTDDNYAKVAQFVQEWYGELGIGVTFQSLGSGALGERVLPPEGDGKANYDIELWGWVGSPDPNALLQIFRCDAIGTTSDSQYCNPEFDRLYDLQVTQAGAERQATLAQMQNLIYDEAPYDILYYDANLVAYRNDRFTGFQNMPSDGTPLFTYGPLDYTLLKDATATPEPTPAAESPSAGSSVAPTTAGPATAAPATPTPSGDGSGASGSGTNTALIVLVLVIVVVVVLVGLVMARRRSRPVEDE